MEALVGLPLTGGGPSYTFEKIVSAMRSAELSARLFAPTDRHALSRGQIPIVATVSCNLARLPYALMRRPAMARIEGRFARACGRHTQPVIAYLWSELSLNLARQLARQRNTFVVREKINCGKRMARRILEEAYASLDARAALPEALSDARIEKERVELHLADAVFCPSPMVRASLLEIGIPAKRLIDTSYGFDPERLKGEHRALEPIDGVTLLFVGTLCVRKDAHVLLESWERAGAKGRLVLVGSIEPLIAKRYAHILARSDVEVHGFQSDVGAYFRSADYFIFPSLEEGDPQVTYEAASCGIPAITTAMGAGAFTRNGIEGIVIDPDRRDDWVDAIRALAPGSRAHAEASAAAVARAAEFAWDKVGKRRREAVLGKFGCTGRV